MPQADLIKLLTANIVAAIIAIGGLAAMVYLFLNTPTDRLGDLAGFLALIGVSVGGATQYLWQTNTQAAARGQTRSDLLTPVEPPADVT